MGLGIAVHFAYFGRPNETVFDEVHFGKFISGYYTREYYFDIHPPLGKLMIAGFAKFFDFKPGFAFVDIGNIYPDNQYIILRFLPNLAGALLPLVIYLLILEMGLSRSAAFFGGLLIVFENALLTQSHYILLDSFLLLFGFLSLLFYFKFRSYSLSVIHHLLLFGFFSGLAISIKWTGLGFLALPLFFEFIKIIRKRQFKFLFGVLLPPLAIAILTYSVFFAVHLAILNKSGPGNSFMTIGFQKTLSGNMYAENPALPSNIFQKFIELNTEMYKANQRLTTPHSYSSQWYTWPLMTRPIFYWVKENARIYLIGNPIIWWVSTAAMLWLAITSLTQNAYFVKASARQAKRLAQSATNNLSERLAIGDWRLAFLSVGYIINILPFIGVKRVMFLYHYLTALIFAILILAYLIDENKNSRKIFTGIIIAAIATFLFFAPLSYGLPLSPEQYQYRVWLNSWL